MSAEQVVARAGAVAAILGGRSVRDLRDGDVLALVDAVGALRRTVDALGATVADVLADRELARCQGERTADLVATRVGIPLREAREWCAVGAAIAPRMALSGEPLPPERPAITAALAAGELPVAAAYVITKAIERVTPYTDLAACDALERAMVDRSADLTLRDLAVLGRRAIDVVDPDGAEPREDLLRTRSGITITRTPDGLVRWVITMHPEAAGLLTTAIDARTAPRRQPTFSTEPESELADDTRTLAQRRLDAITDLARESLQHDPGQVAGSPVTMLVTVALDTLLSGIGTARIAGIDEPVSAATARRLAADAEIIPAVLDGCDGGPTDLNNGVLMCPFHHRRLDRDGWHLQWRDHELWLIPPRHVDAERAPRKAGRVPDLV